MNGGSKRFLRAIGLCVIMTGLFSCASYRYKVVVGMSQQVEERYGEYLSVEVDAAIVDAEQETEIKSAGVDEYFNPQTPLRSRAKAQIIRFAVEDVDRQMVKLTAKAKAGTSLLVIADLPPVVGVNLAHDGRVLFLPLKKTMFRRKVYVEVNSTYIAQVDRKKLSQNRAKRTEK